MDVALFIAQFHINRRLKNIQKLYKILFAIYIYICRLFIWDSIPFLYFTIIKMRKITIETTRAFANMQAITKSNVCVDYGINWHMYYYLHNNLIWDYNEKNWKLTISDAWRQTNTTKERLNWILTAFWLSAWIYQKNRQRYIWDEKRTGQKTFNV